MSWETVTLGDIAEFSNGVNFDKSAYTKGVKLIGVSNFGERFKPDYYELEEIKEDVVRKNDYLQNGDIVFVRSNGNKALVGRCMLIDNAPVPVTYSGFCIRCRFTDTNNYDPVFFTYHFKSVMFRQAMSGTAVGANIQNLSQGRMSTYTAKIPDIETQRHIASILSAYDDLIENNEKQIKLLEEAAQRLYKEWFVDLRFPGWENTPVVDGVPQGWKCKQIYNIAEIKAGGDKPEIVNKSKSQDTPFPIFANGIENDGLYGFTKNAVIEKESVTISARGTVGFVFLRRTPYVPIVRLLSVIPYSLSAMYLYYCLKNETFERNGTSQQQITVPMVKNKVLLIADNLLINEFVSKATVYHNKIDMLKSQIELLTEARDRLLPKLMSGELEV